MGCWQELAGKGTGSMRQDLVSVFGELWKAVSQRPSQVGSSDRLEVAHEALVSSVQPRQHILKVKDLKPMKGAGRGHPEPGERPVY